MESFSTQNRVTDNDNVLEDNEEHEFPTSHSRGKHKESPEACRATYEENKAHRILPAIYV